MRQPGKASHRLRVTWRLATLRAKLRASAQLTPVAVTFLADPRGFPHSTYACAEAGRSTNTPATSNNSTPRRLSIESLPREPDRRYAGSKRSCNCASGKRAGDGRIPDV